MDIKISQTKKPIEDKPILLSKVEVEFKNGVASEIRAFSKDNSEVFSNHWYKKDGQTRPRYGVSFRHNSLTSRYDNYWLIGEKDPKTYIKLADVLRYQHSIELNFSPNNTTISLDVVDKPKELLVATSLNSYIYVNIYTDVLGLLRSDQGNGIIQTEASAKIFFSTLPHKKRLAFSFNYIMPYLRYARFENGFETIPNVSGSPFTNTGTIDRMAVNQRKYLDIGLKLNIFNFLGRFDNAYELNTFTGFAWFDARGPIDAVKTTKVGTTQYQGIVANTFEFGLEGRSSIVQYRNFGINLGAMIALQKIINNDSQLNSKKDPLFINAGLEPYYRVEWEVFYFPVANKQNKIFLRTYYTFNSNEKEDNFLRVQLGFKGKVNLSNKK